MSHGTAAAHMPAPLEGAGNLAGLLSAAAQRWPDRGALRHDGSELTYAELDRRSRQAAAYLRNRGVQPGDRVGLQVPNSFAFVSLYFGILRLGAIVVPQNPLATPRETRVALDDAGAEILLTPDDDARVREAHPEDALHPVAPDDTAVILYTSGTTGTPKGAELTHANLGRNARAAVDIYGLTIDDVVLGVLPLYHSYGQTCTLNGAIAVGARVVLQSRFDAARAADAISADRITVLLGVPTMFSDLAHFDAPQSTFASLRICSCGGAPLPPEVLDAFEARTGRRLHETYGLSETSPIASFNGRDGTRRAGTAGWPIAGTEMKIAGPTGEALPPGEIGQIAIRGHNIMKGYWANPKATREAIDPEGWFYSGDLGAVDEDGAFRVVGRLKEMIIRGGFNIYPRELEDLLHQHPAVRATAVVGVPDQRLGEEVGAAVVLEPGATATPNELRDWMKARVTPYKYPRHVWFVDQLPKGPTGKILKREIVPPVGVTTAAGSRPA
jgi:long-chain acyl-CoA synthetase